MNISNPTTHRSHASRSAFTLVELMVVILIIGILAAIILPAIGGAFNSANELAIRNEMVQLEGGIEAFKTKYGFYPPSFQQFQLYDDASSPNQTQQDEEIALFLPFLNRISPNHQESTSTFPTITNRSRLQVWWSRVGRFLDQETSMVFWLSGLCKSKQFPLTGGADFPIPAYNTDSYSNGDSFTLNGSFNRPDGSEFNVERDVISDFNNNQLVFYTIPGNVMTGTTPTYQGNRSANFSSFTDIEGSSDTPAVAAYLQPAGRGETTYKYRDAASYQELPYAYFRNVPGHSGAAVDTNVPVTQEDFVNPKTFQLISFGMDGESGVPFKNPANEAELRLQASAFPVNPTVLAAVLATNGDFVADDEKKLASFANRAADNQVNFAAGRLDLYWIENE